MKNFFLSRDKASKGVALMIVLALVVLVTGMALAYFSRTTTDRQLAQSSYNDTSSELLARSALNIVVGDFKQEIVRAGTTVTRTNIQPQRSGADTSIPNLIRRSVRSDPIPAPGVSSLASAISSAPSPSASPKRGEITLARWNSHYLVPRLNTGTQIDSTPISTFTAPDWVLLTRAGPAAFSGWDNSLKDTTSTNNNYVVGRYAFAVYDEGGLLDMSVAGYPNWSGNPVGSCNPAPTPWLANVGRKGTVALADLTALGTYAPPQTQIDSVVGWRNYATTLRPTTQPFGNFIFAGDPCATQDTYGSYLLYFGEPPFTFDVTNQPIPLSSYPFSAVYPTVSNSRTDQAFMTRQQLLKLRTSLDFSQNVLQYMGTFSRERNRPAPDWPFLQNNLSEGRFCFDNLDMVKPNPDNCTHHGRGKGQGKSRGRGHLCGTQADIVNLFGLLWIHSDATATPPRPGYWRYIAHNGPTHDPNPNAIDHIPPFRGPNHQNDFFQVLDYALFRVNYGIIGDADPTHRAKSFAIGAALIDQYDSGVDCPNNEGCDLDNTLTGNAQKYQTHTTVIDYGGNALAYGMEPNRTGPNGDSVNGDDPYDPSPTGNNPHRPQNAPTPASSTYVMSHGFSTVGEFGYGIDTSTAGLPTLDFTPPNFSYAPVLDFFSYNPVSSAYPRAGIVNLYTRNEPVLAAILARTLKTDPAANANPSPSPVIAPSPSTEPMQLAHEIALETQGVLAGAPPSGWPITQIDMTRAIAARLAVRAANQVWGINTPDETKKSLARALAELGQTRTWNLLIDVIAQTGHYGQNAQRLTDFIPEGEKRYWLHIALGRDLVHTDGTPCQPGDTGCQVDVLGTQLEEVVE